ncbi:hypothetical protein [Halorubrum kocurii]|uniref:hypothetical protein n=1 Tax=Halorubrum kocurii TaxID=478441 RepID=UPI001375FA35|nr:hypothetical protein [Halorubrum kocurii]
MTVGITRTVALRRVGARSDRGVAAAETGARSDGAATRGPRTAVREDGRRHD